MSSIKWLKTPPNTVGRSRHHPIQNPRGSGLWRHQGSRFHQAPQIITTQSEGSESRGVLCLTWRHGPLHCGLPFTPKATSKSWWIEDISKSLFWISGNHLRSMWRLSLKPPNWRAKSSSIERETPSSVVSSIEGSTSWERAIYVGEAQRAILSSNQASFLLRFQYHVRTFSSRRHPDHHNAHRLAKILIDRGSSVKSYTKEPWTRWRLPRSCSSIDQPSDSISPIWVWREWNAFSGDHLATSMCGPLQRHHEILRSRHRVPHNAILRRLWLNMMKVISSTHIPPIVRYPTPTGMADIRGYQVTARTISLIGRRG